MTQQSSFIIKGRPFITQHYNPPCSRCGLDLSKYAVATSSSNMHTHCALLEMYGDVEEAPVGMIQSNEIVWSDPMTREEAEINAQLHNGFIQRVGPHRGKTYRWGHLL
jgi:hypothetical protein